MSRLAALFVFVLMSTGGISAFAQSDCSLGGVDQILHLPFNYQFNLSIMSSLRTIAQNAAVEPIRYCYLEINGDSYPVIIFKSQAEGMNNAWLFDRK